jgi:hypothetical protein
MDKSSEEIHWLSSLLEMMVVPLAKLTGPLGRILPVPMDMLVRLDGDSGEGFPFSQLRVVLALPLCVLQFHSLLFINAGHHIRAGDGPTLIKASLQLRTASPRFSLCR